MQSDLDDDNKLFKIYDKIKNRPALFRAQSGWEGGYLGNLIAACAAARRAIGTRNGEQET